MSKRSASTDRIDRTKRLAVESGATEQPTALVEKLRTLPKLQSLRSIEATSTLSNHLLIYGTFDQEPFERRIDLSKNNLSVSMDKKWIGYLEDEINIDSDLSGVHPELGSRCVCVLESFDTLKFKRLTDQDGGEAYILIGKPWKGNCRYYRNVYLDGKRGRQLNVPNHLSTILDDDLVSACRKLLAGKYGLDVGRQNSNPNKRSDRVLVDDLLKSYPNVRERYKSCEAGTFVCPETTNIWQRATKVQIEKDFERMIHEHLPELSINEKRMLESTRSFQTLSREFCKELVDDDFLVSLNTNLDVYAVRNGVMRRGDTKLTPIKPQDRVQITCGWFYDQNLARKHRSDVEDFFQKLFPLTEEREIVLTFIASLLDGHRTDKKLLLLTDKRSGNNGKSTLLSLLRVFFGSYLKSSTKFVCKSSIERDRDSHDAGMQTMIGKRVVVADELKSYSKLDMTNLKSLTSGEFVAEGRRFNSDVNFRFIWQAGIILVFNENDCPKFDAMDTAFAERLVVCPMRSKFVGTHESLQEENTFLRDEFVNERFPLWCSALLDHLISFKSSKGLADKQIPLSMREWKQDTLTHNNPIGEWIRDNVVGIEEPNNFVSMSELRRSYANDTGTDARIIGRHFDGLARAALALKSIEVKDYANFIVNGKRVFRRHVAVKCKLVEQTEH